MGPGAGRRLRRGTTPGRSAGLSPRRVAGVRDGGARAERRPPAAGGKPGRGPGAEPRLVPLLTLIEPPLTTPLAPSPRELRGGRDPGFGLFVYCGILRGWNSA